MNLRKTIEIVEKPYLKKDVPSFKSGDKVRVSVRVEEGDKSRLQAFEGIVIRRRGSGTRETFTVTRDDRTSSDQVEKTFFLHSPVVEKVTVLHSAKPGRAKLYHLRKIKKIELSRR